MDEQSAIPSVRVMASEGPDAASDTATAPMAEVLNQTGCVLVAEDDEDSRALIGHLLERAGFYVWMARDGEEVFEILQTRTPHLFLLDCDMPRRCGFDVCAALKADPRWADVPVIFLTAWAEPQDKARGFQVGGADYVTKPVEELELLARLNSQLELARHRHALQRRASLLEEVAEEHLDQLDMLRTGQELLLTPASSFPNLKLGTRFEPAHEAGGDFYEIRRLCDDEVALLVADVSGHDLSVPFITGALKALAATFLSADRSGVDVLTCMNRSLAEVLSPGLYVTASCVRVNTRTMTAEVASAGHPPVIHQPCGAPSRAIEVVGDVLGMFGEARFGSCMIEVGPGDRLFLYSDGIIEAYQDEQGRSGRAAWGGQTLKQALDQRAELPVEQVVEDVIEAVIAQSAGPVGDDMVLLGFEF